MKDDETLSVYLTRFLELVNQMKGYGEDLSRGRLVQKLLISLTKEFDLVCYVIEQTKDIETIEAQEVIAALRGFAQRLDRHAESTTERAFSSMSVNQKGTQSSSSSGDAKPKKNWKLKGKPKCYGCNRFGHYIKECDQANKARKVANLANQNVKCRVKMGTGDLIQSTGKDTLVIEMQGVTRYIKEVMIVPGLDENLLSVGQMVEHGYWLVFGDNVVDIYEDRQMQDLIASVPMKGNRCFPLSLEYVKPSMANKIPEPPYLGLRPLLRNCILVVSFVSLPQGSVEGLFYAGIIVM
ncbi:unnamed protein product [Prunus armeniaca]